MDSLRRGSLICLLIALSVNLAAQQASSGTIEGVVLHMSGFWELDFDVTAKGVTERATTRIDLE
jgi:hypothetical protein